MYKLAFVIVTYQRPNILSELLNTSLQEWEKRNFGVYVLDGSLDDKTKNLIGKLNYCNLHYISLPNTSIGYRVIEGCQIADAEYICICGDSIRPIFSNYNKLEMAFSQKYDLIDFTYRDIFKLKSKIYTDIVEMYRELTWDMTQMGNVFFKKKSYSIFSYIEYRESYNTDYFIQNAIYFDCFKETKFIGYFCGTPILNTYNGQKPHSWNDKILEVGAFGWYDYVKNSSPKYDLCKLDVMMSHGTNSSLHFDKKISFIKLRIKGVLTIEEVKKYELYLKCTAKVDVKTIKKISKMPRKFLYLIYRLLIKIKNK